CGKIARLGDPVVHGEGATMSGMPFRVGAALGWTLIVLAGFGGLAARQPEAKQKEQPGRVDRHGDPLPAEAVARLGAARFRHDGDAALLAYSKDGNKLIGFTASGIIVWEAATGKEL